MSLSGAKAAAVAHWAFDEASGDRTDSINSIVLTDNNTVGSLAGKFSNCADFESGNSEYLNCASNSNLQMGDVSFSIRFWFNAESLPAGTAVLVSKEDRSVAGDREYQVLIPSGSPDYVRFQVYKSTDTVVTVTSAQALSAGTWYLVHAWHDADNDLIGISVNNETAVTQSTAGALQSASTSDFRCGFTPTFGYYDGVIDDLVIMKGYVLTADDRADDYNSGTGVAFADWPSVTAPVISSVTLSGTSQIGNTLTATVVTDQDPVDSTAYRWQTASDGSGTSAADISGETASTLALTYADFGSLLDTAAYVRCGAIATKNALPSDEAFSAWQVVTVPSSAGLVSSPLKSPFLIA